MIVYHKSKTENFQKFFKNKSLKVGGTTIQNILGDGLYCFISEGEKEHLNTLTFGDTKTYFKVLNPDDIYESTSADDQWNYWKKHGENKPIRYQYDGDDCIVFYDPYNELKIVKSPKLTEIFNKIIEAEIKPVKIKVFHGSYFQPSKDKSLKDPTKQRQMITGTLESIMRGAHFVQDKQIAASYGPFVSQIEITLKNPIIADLKGKSIGEQPSSQKGIKAPQEVKPLIQKAKDFDDLCVKLSKFPDIDGIIIKNVKPDVLNLSVYKAINPGEDLPATNVIVFDKTSIQIKKTEDLNDEYEWQYEKTEPYEFAEQKEKQKKQQLASVKPQSKKQTTKRKPQEVSDEKKLPPLPKGLTWVKRPWGMAIDGPYGTQPPDFYDIKI